MGLFDYAKDEDSRTPKVSTENIEWEEALVAGEKVEGGESMTLKSGVHSRRLFWFLLVAGVFVALLIFQTAHLQFVEGKELRVAAEENRIRSIPARAPRGVVKDREGVVLAENVPSFDVVFVPTDLPEDSDELSRSLDTISSISETPKEELKNTINEARLDSIETETLIYDLEKEKALRMMTVQQDLGGIHVQEVATRNYPDGNFFSHVLGYLGPITKEELDSAEEAEDSDKKYYLNDTIGKAGIEEGYEEWLRGENGLRQIEVDSSGQEDKELAYKESVRGHDVVLGIDSEFQKYLTERLKESADANGDGRAAAAAVDPRTGEVRAFVSLPSFDNNIFSKREPEGYEDLLNDPLKPLLNRVITGAYSPGSTVKPGVAAAALQEGVISPNTTIMDKGVISVKHEYDPNITYEFVGYERSGLGPVDVYKYIAKSSDIFSYYIGGGFEGFQGLGLERLRRYYQLFGFGAQLGIDISGEVAGNIPDADWKMEVKNEPWYLGDLYHLSIGQGDMLSTPLQVVNYIAGIANNGKIMKPHLASKIINPQTGEEEVVQTEVIQENFIDQGHLDVVQDAMRQNVTDGSGSALNSLPFTAAGKTGTAEFTENGVEGEHAWYVCYAPFDDPEIALVVLVEGGGEGHAAAVPVARDALEWYFSH